MFFLPLNTAPSVISFAVVATEFSAALVARLIRFLALLANLFHGLPARPYLNTVQAVPLSALGGGVPDFGLLLGECELSDIFG